MASVSGLILLSEKDSVLSVTGSLSSHDSQAGLADAITRQSETEKSNSILLHLA